MGSRALPVCLCANGVRVVKLDGNAMKQKTQIQDAEQDTNITALTWIVVLGILGFGTYVCVTRYQYDQQAQEIANIRVLLDQASYHNMDDDMTYDFEADVGKSSQELTRTKPGADGNQAYARVGSGPTSSEVSNDSPSNAV